MKVFYNFTPLFLLIFLVFFAQSAKSQACGYGHGQIAVFNNKGEPINEFTVTIYSIRGLVLTNKTKVTRVENMGNGWDIYLYKEEAENFIKDKKPYTSKWDNDKKIVYYKDNTYNYRTLENGNVAVLAKVSANGYENFYFVSPIFYGCGYYKEITLQKK